MQSQKSSAFSLLEVLLALFVLAVSMTILTNLQIRSIGRVGRNREEIEYSFIIKKQLYDLFLHPPKNKKPRKEVLEEPAIKLESRKVSLHKKSSLFPLFKDSIAIIRSQGEWKGNRIKKTMTMISFVFEKEKNTGQEEMTYE